MKDKFFLFLNDISVKISDFINENKPFLIVSKKTVDGISASTLILHYLYYNNVQFHFTTVQNYKQLINILSEFPEDVIVFIDFGSELIDNLNIMDSKKEIFIFDHHYILKKEKTLRNIYQINPELFGINGFREISTSGIIYYLLKTLNHDFYELEYLSLVGALGDYQNKEFIGLNSEILKKLVNSNIIEVKDCIQLFGAFSRPLYKSIEFSDIYIPKITGNETNSINLLKNLKISLKRNKDFTHYEDLSDEEKEKLAREIIRLRKEYGILKSDDIFGKVYLLRIEDVFKDLEEIVYAIRALCIYDEYSQYILSKIGNKFNVDNIYEALIDYKKNLLKTITKIFEKKVKILESGQIITIFVENSNKFVENVTEIVVNNSWFPGNRVIICYTENKDNYIVSARHTSQSYAKDLHRTIIQAAAKVNGYIDPYSSWSTVVIPKEKFNEFMTNFKIFAKQNSIII